MGRMPCRRPDVVCQAAGDEALLYDPVADAVHALNRAAWAVWTLCDGRHSVAAIEAALRVQFAGTEGHDVAGELLAVLARLQAEGLVSDRAVDTAPEIGYNEGG